MKMLQASLTTRVHDWVFSSALPFWAQHGMDPKHGGPVEAFSMDGAPSDPGFKRTRVVARQLYVFSHAQILGFSPAAVLADELYQYLVERCWLGADQGWARRLTSNGKLLDPTPDLYDFAFVLFALAWRYKATADAGAIEIAHATLDYLDRHFKHPTAQGYHNAIPAALPRQQNPHMHLTEAAVALAQGHGDARFAMLANDLAQLMITRMAPPPSHILREFFSDNWGPAPGDEGRWVEPGHLFEWAWILGLHQAVSGQNHVQVVSSLVQFAEAQGVDAQKGWVWNGVRDDGLALDCGSRTWPNTERMKGWIALWELTGKDPVVPLTNATQSVFQHFLDPAPPGLWWDSFDASGALTAKLIPTSSLYHVFLAFSEYLRVAPKLHAAAE